jgi:F0F1-type ATP synthase membrane subunit c/vacuolar-type H+-ATPase subunit K
LTLSAEHFIINIVRKWLKVTYMDLVALKFIAIGLSVLGMLGAGLGVANIFSTMLSGLARNPESEDKMKKYVYTGAALVEAMGLFAFLLALLLIFVV